MIHYKEGYKYQLTKDYLFYIGQRVNDNLYPPDKQDERERWYWEASPFLRLYPRGKILMSVGYAWDGCSGPTIDDDTNQVPGLEHDGIYQLIRDGIIPEDPYRKIADERLRDGCKERGMNSFRAWYYYSGVRLAGYRSATEKRKIYKVE